MSVLDVTTGIGPGIGVRAARRALDIMVSSLLLLVTLPPMAVIALALALSRSGPVLFRQVRVGEGARPFTILKFRTMEVRPPRPRVHRRGGSAGHPPWRCPGALHADELPQLVNVLRGEMTLVGPRPETPALAARYPSDCRWVLMHRPGMTGPCQIWIDRAVVPQGRDPEDHYLSELVRRRVALDRAYLEAPTLERTLAILLLTAAVVLRLRSPGPERGR